jgi:hypothetical protein
MEKNNDRLIEIAREAVRAAKREMASKDIEALRRMPPEEKLSRAFELWREKRDEFYRQGLERGLTHEEAMRAAARMMLELKTDE